MKTRITAILLSLALLLSLLTLPALGSPAPQVRVIIENTTFPCSQGAPWDGVLVDTKVELTASSTMMNCVARALAAYGYTAEGLDSGYIEEIQGLAAFDGGFESGWMGCLNDWFTNYGFDYYSVADGTLEAGDEICIRYTCGYGEDIGSSWSNNDTGLDSVAFSSGVLNPTFSKEQLKYTLTLPEGTELLTVTPTAANKNFQVHIKLGNKEYKRSASIPVADGDVLTLEVGTGESMNSNATPTYYTFTLEIPQAVTEPQPMELTMNHSLSLANDISINYLISASRLADYDSFRLECEVPVYEGNQKTGTRTVTPTPILKGSYYQFTLDGLTAIHMNDEIASTLYAVKNGKEYYSPTDLYSIGTYAYNQLSRASVNAGLRSLCAELLRYGAQAQSYKGYRTDALVNSRMTEGYKALLTPLDTVTFGNNNAVLEDLTAPSVTWVGKSLSLESRVVVRFVFDASKYTGKLEDLTLRVSYIDVEGNTAVETVTSHTVFNEGRRQYVFEFDRLRSAELRSVLSAAIYEGDTPVSATMIYSVDTYGNNKKEPLLSLCRAMISFSDRALAFFRG
ncbi:MAG: DUF4430 domain-containing protein [Oscillospiraceae bacterium]|nr:DUF4430 domain-containing protein [Oscillospiraceae bacterium]